MNNQEEISNLYSILNQKETWLNRKSNLEKKLVAIKRLGFYGDSQSIYALVKFLNHNSSEIRIATINSIQNLFKELDTKKACESSLRHCNIFKGDIREYIKHYKNEELKYPLAIASINSNGHVREEALQEILKKNLSNELIQFVIYRLGDWVPQVRNSAVNNYNKVLKEGNWKSVIDNIDLIFSLKNIQRVDLTSIFNSTIKFLTVENASETFSHFPKLSEKTRFKLISEILKSNSLHQLAQTTLLSDKSYLVRSKLAENIHRLKNQQTLISILEKDKSGIVRQKCLESRMKIDSANNEIDFQKLLFDKSSTIRNIAMFYLKDSNLNILEIYKSGLKEGKLRESSIYGIGELGSKSEVDILMPFLASTRSVIKKASIRSIVKLDASRISTQLTTELDSNLKSIRKLAIQHLSRSPSDEILKRCRDIYHSGNVGLKLSMLSFFGKNCSYKTLPDLINAVTDTNEDVANSAWSHLVNWRTKSISNYTKQTEEDKLRAKMFYEKTKFQNKLSFNKDKLWKEIPYFGRFSSE